MENASKALLMAAGVLIGTAIISLVVYLFVSFGSSSAQIYKQMEEQQIAQFNSQFTSYEGKECTIYDVVTLANLATDNNNNYGWFSKRAKNSTKGEDNYIFVILDDGTASANIENSKPEENNQRIAYALSKIDEKQGLPKYKIQVSISETTKRVYLVYVTKIKG